MAIFRIFLLLLFPLQLFCSGPIAEKMFSQTWLNSPLKYGDSIVERFVYHEIERFIPDKQEGIITLSNGYARSKIINQVDYKMDHQNFRVHRIDVVYTKYPILHKDWLTNYYELLARRLLALFEADERLNDATIEWNLVSQTACITAVQARQFFHGIVIYTEPLPPMVFQEQEINEEEFHPIENQGFIFRNTYNPDVLNNRFNPDPDGSRKIIMRVPDVKCPRWR
jgi:hypothetical protein